MQEIVNTIKEGQVMISRCFEKFVVNCKYITKRLLICELILATPTKMKLTNFLLHSLHNMYRFSMPVFLSFWSMYAYVRRAGCEFSRHFDENLYTDIFLQARTMLKMNWFASFLRAFSLQGCRTKILIS